MAQNLIEKIAQKYTVGLSEGQTVHSDDYISIRPAHILTHDNTGAVMTKFRAIGVTRMSNPRQPMFALDHNVQDRTAANLKKYADIEAFAKEMRVDFYPAGRGIGHQIMLEEGYAFPGSMAVASDSHANMYGGIGCLGTPVVRTDAAAIWATGRTWWQIPPVAKVTLNGELPTGVTGKDLIIVLCGIFNQDEVLNHALEFAGDGVADLAIDERFTIANMTTEWGALAGLFPVDDVAIRWLNDRINVIKKRGLEGVPSAVDGQGGHPRLNNKRCAELQTNILRADTNAYYAKELTVDLSTVVPHVAGPHNVKTITSVTEIEKRNIRINKAYLVSCVNSRVEDLAQAARVVAGKKVAEGVELYIAAASQEVQEESEKRGDWQTLIKAGAIALPPGCGPCIGLGAGLLQDGEVGISATNRNFKGRMGSREAEAYLASPAVVAASAITGKITGPDTSRQKNIKYDISINPQLERPATETSLLDGFPDRITGAAVFCYQDNLNTDGIFPGKYTYRDDFTPEQQAAVVMENYDPEFGRLVESRDILVGGFNFGSGSSREQAATALKYRRIQLVLAGSFSQTYKRNAINNGYLVLEAPELVADFKRQFGTAQLTVKTGLKIIVDFKLSNLICNDKTYAIGTIGIAAQELILAGGLENWVKKRIVD